MSGLEYRVYLGPMNYGPEAAPNEGRWVIHKQVRRIDYDNDRSEVQVLATYFVVGISVYLAPSVGELLTTRLVGLTFGFSTSVLMTLPQLSTTSSLNKLMQKASSLRLYSPGLGHHYMPSNLAQKDRVDRTPAQSREASLAPEQANQLSQSAKKARAQGSDVSTLLGAYQQFNNFGNDYMDENPLQGEPGSFVFSNSREHVQARREAEAKRAQQQEEMKKAQEEAKKAAADLSRVQSEAPKVETPAAKPEKVSTPSRKGSRAPPDGDLDRARKSKKRKTLNAKTPGTPRTPGTPLVVPG